MTRFPRAEQVWRLHQLEEQFRSIGQGILTSEAYSSRSHFKCREMGRASGFFTCAAMAANMIAHLDRSFQQRTGKVG